MSMKLPVYSIDTSSLIEAWLRRYSIDNFPSFWYQLEALISGRKLVASVEVMNDLARKDDDLLAWCRKLKDDLSIEISDTIQDYLIKIMSSHPRLVDTSTGRSGSDPFIIALALSYTPTLTVVSEESPGKRNSPKIPDVCQAYGIRCIRLVDLIRQEAWRF